MNTEIVTLLPTASAQEAAKLMMTNEIGSVVIVDPNELQKPIGIITERDMSSRVVAENRQPSEISCEEIMSSPIRSILPDLLITEAMHQMATQHIKRLIVMEDQKMIGLISQSDILTIAPYMIEILQEKAEHIKENIKIEYISGYCQLCENWSDMLEEIDEMFICQDCKSAKMSEIY